MKKILIATLLLSSSMAFAADLPSRTAPVTPVAHALPAFTWTGLYAGVNGGYGLGKANYTHANTNFFGFAGGGYSNDVYGALVGGQVGYNYQMGKIILGVEASADFSSVKGNENFSQYANNTTTKQRDLYMLSGKVGTTLFDPRFMVYAKGGLAAARFEAGQDYYAAVGARSFAAKKFVTGWQAGLGAEYALTSNVSVGAEWTHVQFSSKPFGGLDSAKTATVINGKFKEDIFLAKVNYRF